MRALLPALVLAAASCSTDPVATDVPAASDAVDIVLPDAPAPVDAGGAQPCTAGRIEECPCGDGRRGMQTCQANGAYGPCMCADAGSPMDVVVVADVVDAAAARDAVVANPGVRFDACALLGLPCSDGTTCMRATLFWTLDGPQGICSSPCAGPCGGDAAEREQICVQAMFGALPDSGIVPAYCARRCRDSSSCPPTTLCGDVFLRQLGVGTRLCMPR